MMAVSPSMNGSARSLSVILAAVVALPGCRGLVEVAARFAGTPGTPGPGRAGLARPEWLCCRLSRSIQYRRNASAPAASLVRASSGTGKSAGPTGGQRLGGLGGARRRQGVVGLDLLRAAAEQRRPDDQTDDRPAEDHAQREGTQVRGARRSVTVDNRTPSPDRVTREPPRQSVSQRAVHTRNSPPSRIDEQLPATDPVLASRSSEVIDGHRRDARPPGFADASDVVDLARRRPAGIEWYSVQSRRPLGEGRVVDMRSPDRPRTAVPRPPASPGRYSASR